VPTERQRLIFRGRLLKDTDSISHYKISDLDVVHLVAKTGEQTNNTEESAMNTDSNPRRRSSDSIFSLMNRLMRGESESNQGNNI
jgi:ubiquilin